MKFLRGWWVVFIWGLVLTGIANAQYPALPGKETKCDSVKDADRRNLCLAIPKAVDIDPSEMSFGYKRKDHSNYYCTLIRNRDLQNLCWAVVGPNPSKCDLVIDKKLEDECKAQFK